MHKIKRATGNKDTTHRKIYTPPLGNLQPGS